MTTLVEASRLGICPFTDTAKVALRSVKTNDDVKAVIWAAYRQVLGALNLGSQIK